MSLLTNPEELARFLLRIAFTTREPRVGEWTDAPNWGRQITTVMPSTTNFAFSVASAEKLPGPPRMHTVQLFRGDARSANNADIYAKVSYGVGAANNSFLVDWSAGAQFSLVANGVHYIRRADGFEELYLLNADLEERSNLAEHALASEALKRFRISLSAMLPKR